MRKGLSIEGAAALAAALAELPRDIRDEFADAIERAAQKIAASAQARAPREFGDLIESIGWDISDEGLTAQVGTDSDHAAFVEWGTSDTPAQPYLFPSFIEVVKPLRKELRALVVDIPLKVRTRVKRDPRTRR